MRHLLISDIKYLGRVLIGHPFNPPHLMPLVEVVPHPGTDKNAVTEALNFYKSVGKRPILVKREAPGFAANRLQAALNYEAYSLVANGILSASDVGEWQLDSFDESMN
jgi:3-hydroxyacyl-CoA dehydrogenase